MICILHLSQHSLVVIEQELPLIVVSEIDVVTCLQVSLIRLFHAEKYLKKGGRITPAAAAIGTVLNLKPVLQIQGEKLDAYTKTRGKEAAKKKMIEAMKKDFENRFASFAKDGKLHLEAAYSGNPEEAKEWKALLEKEFPGYEINMDPLSLSISCHIGKGALAVAVSAYLPELED